MRGPCHDPIRERFAVAARAALRPTPRRRSGLGGYPVDPAQVSVSGLSSGAFMANQFHIAHSADIMGAAMIAGGLYGCAVLHPTESTASRRWMSQAVGPCM